MHGETLNRMKLAEKMNCMNTKFGNSWGLYDISICAVMPKSMRHSFGSCLKYNDRMTDFFWRCYQIVNYLADCTSFFSLVNIEFKDLCMLIKNSAGIVQLVCYLLASWFHIFILDSKILYPNWLYFINRWYWNGCTRYIEL